MMTLHEKLFDLADRLKADGRDEDAATVYSAAMQLAPTMPTPVAETMTQVAPGYYFHFRQYR